MIQFERVSCYYTFELIIFYLFHLMNCEPNLKLAIKSKEFSSKIFSFGLNVPRIKPLTRTNDLTSEEKIYFCRCHNMKISN